MNQTIPILKIGGVPVTGAYGIDFSIGGSDNPSTLNLTLVNESGKYNWPNFNTNNPVKIEFGPIKFSGYAVDAGTSDSSNGGKIFNIKYIDTSNILDRIYIGLKGKMGPGFTSKTFGQFNNVILVGDEVDPCENRNINEVADPCAPDCEAENGTTRQPFNCVEERLTKILDVSYSFNDLKNAVSGRVKFGNFPVSITDDYKDRHTGTLRSVLKSWCQAYALVFYWDASTNSVNFVDLKTGIVIDDSAIVQGNCQIQSQNERRSIEDNIEYGNIAYFGGEGERREYSCEINASQRRTLSQITLKDLFVDPKGNVANWFENIYGKGEDGEDAVSRFESSCALAYYSTELRDLVYLYNVYDIENPQKARDAIDKKMLALGNLSIKKVLESISEDGQEKAAYRILVSRMSATEAKDFIDRKGYFIVAEYDENLHKKITGIEEGAAQDFIGRYWFDAFPGGRHYSLSAPDGGVELIENGNEFSLDFLDKLPGGAESAHYYLDNVLPVDETGNARGSFILLDRPGVWSPPTKSEEITKVLKDVSDIEMTMETFEDVGGFNFIGKNQVIFRVYPKPDTFIFQNYSEGINSLDAKNTSASTELNGVNVAYGLVSAECRRWRLKTKSANFLIEFPSQAHLLGNNLVDGYQVIAQRENFNTNQTVILPKLEYVLGNVKAQSSKSVGLSINYRDATQNILSAIQRLEDGSCGYDEARILQLLQNFNSRFFSHNDFVKITKSYTLSGLPTRNVSVKDGLESFQIRVGSAGCTTDISFSNLPKTPKADELAIRDFDRDNLINPDKIQAGVNHSKKYYKK